VLHEELNIANPCMQQNIPHQPWQRWSIGHPHAWRTCSLARLDFRLDVLWSGSE